MIEWIADPASNHNGSLVMAQRLIHAAATAGATAIKFQFFTAKTLIDRKGFEYIGKLTHQSKWKDDIYETYQKYETPLEWIPTLARDCERANIKFMATPYNKEAVDALNDYVTAFKIGSGDINYFPLIQYVEKTGKKMLFGLGAATHKDVEELYRHLKSHENKVFMQCNTNYSNGKNNYKYLNLKYLDLLPSTYSEKGLSDHTKDLFPVHVAIAYGARYIERHFKIEKNNSPDDHFSLDPREWKTMIVSGNKCLESLGTGKKIIEPNEKETRIIQRRNPFNWLRPDITYKVYE